MEISPYETPKAISKVEMTTSENLKANFHNEMTPSET
jgi:hypothetical protein